MTTVRFDWQIPKGDYFDEASLKLTSELRYTNGFKIVCVWCDGNFAPKSIEFHQKRNGRDAVLIGEFTLLMNGREILRKSYMQLIQSGSTFMKISLKDATLLPNIPPNLLTSLYSLWKSPGTYSIPNFSLKGHVKIETDFSMNSENQQNLMSSLMGLSLDFKKLLNPETACMPTDVNLKCGGGSIQAHKIVLSTRSPVFERMFAHSMLESRLNEVVITDVDATTMRALVNYMYTGSVSKIPGKTTNRSVGDLLIAADKYQMLTLKLYCRYLLIKQMTFENVLWILELGDTLDGELKSRAIDFICQCPEFSTVKQRNSEAWKSLERNKHDLAMEVLTILVTSKDEKIKKLRTP